MSVETEGEENKPAATEQVNDHSSSSDGDVIIEDIDGSTTEAKALSAGTKKDIGVSQSHVLNSQSSLNQSQGELHVWCYVM